VDHLDARAEATGSDDVEFAVCGLCRESDEGWSQPLAAGIQGVLANFLDEIDRRSNLKNEFFFDEGDFLGDLGKEV